MAILAESSSIPGMTESSERPATDQEAIGKTLLTLLTAFDDRDADPLRGVYVSAVTRLVWFLSNRGNR
jgi:hypothetical protein